MNIFYKPIDDNARYLSLDEAIMYCTFLDHKGMKGWRLPTPEEVLEIKQHRKQKRASAYIYEPHYVWTTMHLELAEDNIRIYPHIGIVHPRILAVRSKNAKESKV